MNIDECTKQGDALFEKKKRVNTLWQEIADNFYPERAQFTISRSVGDDFADNLMSSYPLIVRRDLGNSFGAMLRRDEWFQIRAADRDREGHAEREWLQRATGLQRRAMYDRQSGFVRATKEGDHDFATFGQCVIRVEFNRRNVSLLYRCYHLADSAWIDNDLGGIRAIHVKWRPTVIDLVEQFGEEGVHPSVIQRLKKAPYSEVECRICVYETGDERFPYEQIIYQADHKHELKRTPMRYMEFVVPRWQTVSGSQYATSPATIVALPDARLLQAMTLTILEAGEMSVRPPLVATAEVIREDVNLMSGGITWVDKAYDERLGDALRPLSIDKSGVAARARPAGRHARAPG